MLTSIQDPPYKRSLANETFLVLIGQVSTAIANFMVGMVLVRYFSDKGVFATYSQAMFLAQTLVAFAPLALHRAIIFFFPRVESQRAFAIQMILIISLVMLVVGTVMIMSRQLIGDWFNNPGLVEVVPLIFGMMWMMNFSSIISQLLLATHRSGLLGILTTIFSMIYLLSMSTAVYFNLGVIGILRLIIIVYAIQAIFTIVVMLRLPGKLSRIRDFSQIIDQLRYSLPLALGSFTGVIGKTMDRFIIMYLFPPAVFAIYDRGAIEIPLVSQLPYSANSILQPRLTLLYKDRKIDEFLTLWHTVVKNVALIMIPIMVLCWLVAKQLIIIVNTDAYLDSTIYFRVYLLLIPFQITVYPAILMVTGHTSKVFFVAITSVFMNILINVLLVKVFQMGPVGPAAATVLVECGKAFFYLWLIGTSIGINLNKIYPWKDFLIISFTAIIAGIICYPLTLINLNSLFMIILCLCVYGGLYLILGLAFRIIQWEDVLGIKHMVGVNIK